ncbi:hypothetical protein EV702DRAFT_1130473 [Suillus placidus]|uniref:Uncharacterized protein n=1 Tax=Suillus placidus TaxID=48579 RepID=A0A9P6ZNE4_9AGAM|nr:hypothetical protein EV702DRAFT_1130473 [Suillus placidus]
MIYYLYYEQHREHRPRIQRAWIQCEVVWLSLVERCFEPRRISPLHNISGTRRAGEKVREGATMRWVLAARVSRNSKFCRRRVEGGQTQCIPPGEHDQFYTYGRVNLMRLGEGQEHILKPLFFAT